MSTVFPKNLNNRLNILSSQSDSATAKPFSSKNQQELASYPTCASMKCGYQFAHSYETYYSVCQEDHTELWASSEIVVPY